MIFKKKQMVRVLAKGGILTPSYLMNVLDIVKSTGTRHVHFGSRQDILFLVAQKQMPEVSAAFDVLNVSYIIHGRKESQDQNIVSSYVSSDITSSTPWLSSGNYLNVLEHFNYQPKIRVNIADPKQSLVPFFYGHLNYIASTIKDYWYLYVRKNEKAIPERWPMLVLSVDIGRVSKRIEEEWSTLNRGSLPDLFDLVQGTLEYNWRKPEMELQFELITPLEYEGFGKMYNSQNYWAGFYWRNNEYDVDFLEEICRLCLRTNISKICLTPWKSFLVKEIGENDLMQWHRLLGRFGINMRHSSVELNWHLPVCDRAALRLKRQIVKKFNILDVCVHGLTFSIKTKPEPLFSTIVIEKVPGIKFLKKFDPFVTFRVLQAQNFNINTCKYEEYMPPMPSYRLPEVLQQLTLKFYAQLLKTNEKQINVPKIDKVDKQIVYQCQNCFSIYDEKKGDPSLGIAENTLFVTLPESYCCRLCESPKTVFKTIFMSHLIKNANA